MDFVDEFPDIPGWGEQFVESIRRHLLQLCGQSRDISIVEQALRRTFALAALQREKLPAEKRDQKFTQEWMLALAEETFTRLLLQRLSLDPSYYFDLLYYAFQQKVRAYIAHFLKKTDDDPEVDCCVQETFIKVFESLTSKARRGVVLEYPFTGWLCTVAKGVCLDYWKEQKREHNTIPPEELEPRFGDESERPDIYAEGKERGKKIQACIDRLPEPCRSYFQLYFEGFSVKEIAARQSLSESDVRNCIYGLGRRHFRKFWLEENGQPKVEKSL